ncbi:MAG: sigma-70 family RNA polymerase sigma factor [Acidobacteria bacterium]|nr:sigma-70 family RNA polymerase sigma factor [Acidobacteriota bacterium]
MQQPWKCTPSVERHEEVFLARYTRLRVWALQLTENDHERAEDLVHDAYIQFTFTRPELDSIHNLDGYLYIMLRNLNLSQLRRSLHQQDRSLSVVDYDSAETGLRVADPREQMRFQDELREVCKYACARKETSRAGSVLILRFLHGYYPGEIAEILRSTRAAVEERLRIARSEARQYLKNPKSLRFLRESKGEPTKLGQPGFARKTDELLGEIRGTIFNSRQGDCLTREHLEILYAKSDSSGIDHETLGHIVSCPQCLDGVNRILNLPLLSERFPTDTLGTDTRSKGGGGSDGSGTSGGQASEREMRRCRKRARDVFEHRPSELCISVNGYLMAAQKVGSELNEQSLSINVAEKIDFVEILSEQDIRLLLVCVEEQSPDGFYKSSTCVRLSDDRTLEVTLSFSNPWPTLQVVYSDPLLNAESAAQMNRTVEANTIPQLAPAAIAQDEVQESQFRPFLSRVPNALAWIRLSFVNPSFWLRPGTITAIVALILVAALLLTRGHAPGVNAADILRRSTIAEEMIAANPGIVLHRKINLEERRPNGGDLLARHRIEVWQNAAHGIRLRRIYDEQNRLVAGEWTKADGTSTVYRRGIAPQSRTAPDVAAGAILETGELWRLDASARDFNALAGRTGAVAIEERARTYVLSHSSDVSGDAHRLVRATLTLSKSNLHAIEQTLVVRRDGEEREYKFTETSFEQKAADAVSPNLFQPEPELLGQPGDGGGASKRSSPVDDSHRSGLPNDQPTERVASPELEIEVTYLLNQIKANLGEQVTMTRNTGGALRVEALVETERRKEEILRALGPVIGNPAVKVEVSTVAEAVKRQQREQSKPRDATAVREVEVANNRISADPELRAYFSSRLVGAAIDEEIDRYASRVMNRSRQALLRASALKRLVRRFSPAEMRDLAADAQGKWSSMIREQALAYRREVATLKQELRAVFEGSGEGASGTVSEANLAEAAERLLQLSYATDEAVRSAFTISADARTAAAIKSRHFWRLLGEAENLADAIQRVYQK